MKKKKKHNQILMFAKSKYNSIEAIISQALNDIDISRKEFITILNEKNKYEKMKEDIEDQKIIKYKNYFFLLYKNVRDNKKELL